MLLVAVRVRRPYRSVRLRFYAFDDILDGSAKGTRLFHLYAGERGGVPGGIFNSVREPSRNVRQKARVAAADPSVLI